MERTQKQNRRAISLPVADRASQVQKVINIPNQNPHFFVVKKTRRQLPGSLTIRHLCGAVLCFDEGAPAVLQSCFFYVIFAVFFENQQNSFMLLPKG